MDLATFHLLQTPAGTAALARARDLHPTAATLLACTTRMRAEFPIALATAALETAILRRKAGGKFTRAAEMFFTREALEQATSEVISRYRAERFAPYARVADLCCGIGGDAIGLSDRCDLVAVDADPLRLAMAEANLRAYGSSDRATLLLGDALAIDLPLCDAFVADPDRRSNGRRHVAMKHYRPNVDQLLDRLPHGCPLGVKIAPAVSHDEMARYDAEAEFVSVDGELKECVLWFGPLRSAMRRATLLPGRHTLIGDGAARLEVTEPRRFLYDPDPAIVRAGLVAELGQALSATQIDPEIAFLTSADPVSAPFATTYQIDEVHPFHLKRLAGRLRQLKVGRITVVKRGSAIDPETLIRGCKLEGPEHRAIILTRAQCRPTVLIGERVVPQQSRRIPKLMTQDGQS